MMKTQIGLLWLIFFVSTCLANTPYLNALSEAFKKTQDSGHVSYLEWLWDDVDLLGAIVSNNKVDPSPLIIRNTKIHQEWSLFTSSPSKTNSQQNATSSHKWTQDYLLSMLGVERKFKTEHSISRVIRFGDTTRPLGKHTTVLRLSNETKPSSRHWSNDPIARFISPIVLPKPHEMRAHTAMTGSKWYFDDNSDKNNTSLLDGLKEYHDAFNYLHRTSSGRDTLKNAFRISRLIKVTCHQSTDLGTYSQTMCLSSPTNLTLFNLIRGISKPRCSLCAIVALIEDINSQLSDKFAFNLYTRLVSLIACYMTQGLSSTISCDLAFAFPPLNPLQRVYQYSTDIKRLTQQFLNLLSRSTDPSYFTSTHLSIDWGLINDSIGLPDESVYYIHMPVHALGTWALKDTSFLLNNYSAPQLLQLQSTTTSAGAYDATKACDILTSRLLSLDPIAHKLKPQFNFWAGGRGTTAHLHFDSYHNLYIHLNGSKTFILFPPSATPALHLFSSLHPHAHQSQIAADVAFARLFDIDDLTYLKNTSNNEEIMTLLHRGTLNSSYFNTSTLSSSHPLPPLFNACLQGKYPHCQCQQRRKSDTTPSKSQLPTMLKQAGAVIATLKPGDILYIPPLWWHHVKANTASSSLNIWCPSSDHVLKTLLGETPVPTYHKSTSPHSAIAITLAWFGEFLNQLYIDDDPSLPSLQQSLPPQDSFKPSLFLPNQHRTFDGRIPSWTLARMIVTRHVHSLSLLIPKSLLISPQDYLGSYHAVSYNKFLCKEHQTQALINLVYHISQINRTRDTLLAIALEGHMDNLPALENRIESRLGTLLEVGQATIEGAPYHPKQGFKPSSHALRKYHADEAYNMLDGASEDLIAAANALRLACDVHGNVDEISSWLSYVRKEKSTNPQGSKTKTNVDQLIMETLHRIKESIHQHGGYHRMKEEAQRIARRIRMYPRSSTNLDNDPLNVGTISGHVKAIFIDDMIELSWYNAMGQFNDGTAASRLIPLLLGCYGQSIIEYFVRAYAGTL